MSLHTLDANWNDNITDEGIKNMNIVNMNIVNYYKN
jgi:hypothetical protein